MWQCLSREEGMIAHPLEGTIMKLMTNEQETRECAWCLEEQGIEPDPDDSHGICPPHSEKIMIDYYTRKYEEVPSYVEQQAARFAREY